MHPAQPDPEGNAALLPEPFAVNAEVVEKAAEAARAALLAVAKRFNRPISRPVRAATPSPIAGAERHLDPLD